MGPPLTSTTEWFWHLNSKQTCAAAVANQTHGLLLGECCYGWVDVAYLPRHTHAAFSRAVPAFWDVQWEVALPTILHGLAATGVAPHRPLACAGGCCAKLSWAAIAPSRLCAHRVDLQHAHAGGIPRALVPPQCTGGGGAAPGKYRWGDRNASASFLPVAAMRQRLAAAGRDETSGKSWRARSAGVAGGGWGTQRRHPARTQAALGSSILG